MEFEFGFAEGFGENVCGLLFRVDVLKINFAV